MSAGPGYACAGCKVLLRPRKNDVTVLITASFGPYQIWQADLWECPECSQQVILGYGMKPWAEHYQPDFKDHLAGVDFTIDGISKELP